MNILISSIYREFVISVSPKIIKKELGGSLRTIVRTYVAITELATGREWNALTEKRIFDSTIESFILNQFPESQSAIEIKSIRNLGEVTLVDDLSPNNMAVCIHTALRKICDSKASAYWWNLIHILPDGMMSIVWGDTSKALGDLPRTAPLYKYANTLQDAWDISFDRINGATNMFSNGKIYGGEEHSLTKDEAVRFTDLFDDMTIKEFNTYKTQAKMAYLALDYLKDDWVGMLGYLIKE